MLWFVSTEFATINNFEEKEKEIKTLKSKSKK
jgi:hypothetical protein